MNFYSVVCLGLLGFTTGIGCAPAEGQPARPTFTPDSELLEDTEAVAARYATATGREDVEIVDNGSIRVFYAEDLYTLDESGVPHTACAITTWYLVGGALAEANIELDPTPPYGCPSIRTSLAHEFIHALNPYALHTEHGLFAVHSDGSTLIDDGALNELCTEFECIVFQPEVTD